MRSAPLITSRCIFTPLNVTHLTGKFPCHILVYMLLQKHLPANHTSTVGHHHVLRRLVIVVIEHLLVAIMGKLEILLVMDVTHEIEALMSGANVEIRLVRLVRKGVVGGLVVRVVKLLILVLPKTSLMLTQALITSIPTRRLQLGSLLFNGHHPLSELPS